MAPLAPGEHLIISAVKCFRGSEMDLSRCQMSVLGHASDQSACASIC